MQSLTLVYDIAKEVIRLELESENYNREPKRELYIKMGNELETQGYDKTKIYSLIHKILQDEYQSQKNDNTVIFNNGWLHYVCSQQGWTESSDGSEKDSSASGRDLIVGECADQRKQFYDFIEDLRKELQADQELMKMEFYKENDEHGNPINIKIKWYEYFDEQQSDVFDHIKNMFYRNMKQWNQMKDSRQSILPVMRLPMVALTSMVLKKDLAHNYYAKVRQLLKITPKKTKQFLDDCTNEIQGKSQSGFFDTLNEDAWLWNFLDIKCPICKKERLQLRIYPDKMPVWVCKNWLFHNKEVTFNLSAYTDRINQLMENRGGSAETYLNSKGIHISDN